MCKSKHNCFKICLIICWCVQTKLHEWAGLYVYCREKFLVTTWSVKFLMNWQTVNVNRWADDNELTAFTSCQSELIDIEMLLSALLSDCWLVKWYPELIILSMMSRLQRIQLPKMPFFVLQKMQILSEILKLPFFAICMQHFQLISTVCSSVFVAKSVESLWLTFLSEIRQ